MRFQDLPIDPRLLRTLEAMRLTEPRPIQREVLPIALAGRDLVALAPTGTGKTVAFGLPLAQRLLAHPPARRRGGPTDPRERLRALVLCPTRELAIQVGEELGRLVKGLVLRVGTVVGKSALSPQREMLRRGVDLLVGTPGRVRELLELDALSLAFVRQVVIDEADRMLDLGFLPQVRWILDRTAASPQRMLFSATMPREVESLVEEFLREPTRVAVGTVNAAAPHLEHRLYQVPDPLKVPLLLRVLAGSRRQAIVFARTRRRVGWVAEALRRNGIAAESLHGDRTPAQRTAAMKAFTEGRATVLVATDVAARGLHVPGVALVVNYDLPLAREEWVHRVGRAAHGGGEGGSISFRTPEERDTWRSIERLGGVALRAEPLPEDLAPRQPAKAPSKPPSKPPQKPRPSRLLRAPTAAKAATPAKPRLRGEGPRIGRRGEARKPSPGRSRGRRGPAKPLVPGRGVVRREAE